MRSSDIAELRTRRGREGTDLEVAVSVEEEVGRLEVAMEDVGGVEGFERTQGLNARAEGRDARQGGTCASEEGTRERGERCATVGGGDGPDR